MPIKLPAPVNVDDVNFETHLVLVGSDSDSEGYAVPRSAAKLSGLLTDLLATTSEGDELKIPINNFHSEAARAIACWMCHFAEAGEVPKATSIPRPAPDAQGALVPAKEVTAFEAEFVAAVLPPLGSTELRMHVTLLNAANFLNVRELLILLGCALAMRFRGRDLDQIRELMEHQLPLTVSDPFSWPADLLASS